MANPQCENGFTKIANELVEAIYQYPLSGHEFRMLFLIIRKTYGFNKTEDAVSLSQMMKALSISKTRCSQVINKLQLQKIVTVTENINGIGKKYKFNKNFEQWTTIHKSVNRYTKVKSTVTVLRKEPLQKSVSTKDTITKDTTKEIPEWVSREMFFTYQQARRKKLKEVSFDLFFKKLKRLSEQSNCKPDEILKQSIENGYEGIFELKTGGNSGNKTTIGTNTYRKNYNDRQLDPETAAAADKINEQYYKDKAALANSQDAKKALSDR
jgi:phage replication O-like protein O